MTNKIQIIDSESDALELLTMQAEVSGCEVMTCDPNEDFLSSIWKAQPKVIVIGFGVRPEKTKEILEVLSAYNCQAQVVILGFIQDNSKDSTALCSFRNLHIRFKPYATDGLGSYLFQKCFHVPVAA